MFQDVAKVAWRTAPHSLVHKLDWNTAPLDAAAFGLDDARGAGILQTTAVLSYLPCNCPIPRQIVTRRETTNAHTSSRHKSVRILSCRERGRTTPQCQLSDGRCGTWILKVGGGSAGGCALLAVGVRHPFGARVSRVSVDTTFWE